LGIGCVCQGNAACVGILILNSVNSGCPAG
jgi:hypothetical protein